MNAKGRLGRNRAILSLAAVFLLAANISEAKYSGGTGEPNNPYRISTPNDLNDIGNHPNDWDKHFVMVNDINLAAYTGTQFNMIGPNSTTPFTGVFDGNSHTISNFTYSSTATNYIGLFGYVGNGGDIKNLSVVDANVDAGTGLYVGALVGRNEDGTIAYCQASATVSGASRVAGLVGYNSGTGKVSDCNATATVTAYSYLAGLCGVNSGTISGCYTSSHVSGGDDSDWVGGLCGYNDYGTISSSHARGSVSAGDSCEYLGGLCAENQRGIISDCYATSSVTGGYSLCLGGLCGKNASGTISNSYATGSVTAGGRWSSALGGLCGYNSGSIANCCATGPVSGPYGSYALGGLCGANDDSPISNSYATGSVTGDMVVGGLCGGSIGPISKCYAIGPVSGSYSVGGFSGENAGTISNCYATGSVSRVGASDALGGLCGRNGYPGALINCYATGAVSPGVGSVGGLCGRNDEGTISNCYFLDPNDGGGPDNGIGTPLTDEQMKQQGSFAAWDFLGETVNGPNDVWRMCLEGVSYPLLWWHFARGDFLCPDGANFVDYSFFANHWRDTDCGVNDCDRTDLDFSDAVDWKDLKIFCDYWLEGAGL